MTVLQEKIEELLSNDNNLNTKKLSPEIKEHHLKVIRNIEQQLGFSNYRREVKKKPLL